MTTGFVLKDRETWWGTRTGTPMAWAGSTLSGRLGPGPLGPGLLVSSPCCRRSLLLNATHAITCAQVMSPLGGFLLTRQILILSQIKTEHDCGKRFPDQPSFCSLYLQLCSARWICVSTRTQFHLSMAFLAPCMQETIFRSFDRPPGAGQPSAWLRRRRRPHENASAQKVGPRRVLVLC